MNENSVQLFFMEEYMDKKERKVIFFCQNCGHEEAKWRGQCPVCKEWNTFAEEKVSAGLSRGTTAAAKQSKNSRSSSAFSDQCQG